MVSDAAQVRVAAPGTGGEPQDAAMAARRPGSPPLTFPPRISTEASSRPMGFVTAEHDHVWECPLQRGTATMLKEGASQLFVRRAVGVQHFDNAARVEEEIGVSFQRRHHRSGADAGNDEGSPLVGCGQIMEDTSDCGRKAQRRAVKVFRHIGSPQERVSWLQRLATELPADKQAALRRIAVDCQGHRFGQAIPCSLSDGLRKAEFHFAHLRLAT